VKRYQADRLNGKAGPKTINDEVQLLIRLCGEQGALIRATLRRDKALKLPLPPSPGRPYSAEEKARMLEEAQKLRTPQLRAALALDLNTGLRDKELREIRWEQIDLVHRKALTVGKSKSEAGTGRVIPLNERSHPDRATDSAARNPREMPAPVVGRSGGRMGRHVEVEDAAPIMGKHQKHIQDLKADRGNGEEVDRHQRLDMVLQEYAPPLRWWLPAPHHVFADTGLANFDAQLEQFAVNSGSAPRRILAAHPANEIMNIQRNRWTTGSSAPYLPCPE
jgi:hypothetical protein